MAALVDRHESLSPASMDGSIYESGHMDERSAKSKIIFVIFGSLIRYLVVKGNFNPLQTPNRFSISKGVLSNVLSRACSRVLSTLLYESPKDSLGKCFVLFFIGTHLMKL